MTKTVVDLLEPAELEPLLGTADLLIVDLCNDNLYSQGHIPGAIHVSPPELVCGIPPATGKLPSTQKLEQLFSRIGLTPDKRVVAYDDEGGGWAGRFLWTLEVIGHPHATYLNGGIHAWKNDGHPLEPGFVEPTPSDVSITLNHDAIAEIENILPRLGQPDFVILDARSPGEYQGLRPAARRSGHIPGAVNCEWTTLMDPVRHYRIRSDAREYLASLGITPEKEVVTHCQSHHRSGFTWLVAKLLGYPRVRGYHGSWSEWGNHDDTPIEI